jgi:hypothetical protein
MLREKTMQDYVTPEIFPFPVNTNGGFLCTVCYWRPNPSAPNPAMPGQKQMICSYLPLMPEDICLCGSGKKFQACCQSKPIWHPICPNPGMAGYSLCAPQTAIFSNIDGKTVREILMQEEQFFCTEDLEKRCFWVYWGSPAFEFKYGIICFGDIELQADRQLIVTALSDTRMKNMQEILRKKVGNLLGTPEIIYDKIQVIDKHSLTRNVTMDHKTNRKKKRKGK